jgi:DNA-binding GntR family transcriptional regulator
MRVETSDIYADLHRKLMTAAFRPGEKLKPAQLQGQYGCSANTVREVLMRLSKVGLVDFEMQRGFRTRDTSPELRSDVTKFRILLEQEGAALSMTNGGLEWESQLAAAHHRLSHIETTIAASADVTPHMDLWSDAELGFHEVLISRCQSPLLRETYASVYAQFRQQMVGQQRDFGTNYFEAIIAEHQAILDAALARDIAGCKAAIYDHLKRNL